MKKNRWHRIRVLRKGLPWAFASFSLLTGGCGVLVQESFSPLNSSRSRPKAKSPSAVRMFLAKRPSQDYVEAGVIDVRGPFARAPSTLLGRVRGVAAKRGCDGVLLSDETSTGRPNLGYFTEENGRHRYRGVCIVFR